MNQREYCEALLQTVSRLLPELPLILMTAVATHLVIGQTLMHYKLGHHPIGGKFFRNHINFHHRSRAMTAFASLLLEGLFYTKTSVKFEPITYEQATNGQRLLLIPERVSK